MRLMPRAVCALVAAGILVWGIDALSQPKLEDFKSQDWQTQGDVSPEHPIVVDTAAREIRVYARVNGKYFHLPTVHNMNYRYGSVGNKALFRAWVNPVTFANALLSLDTQPGQNFDAKTTEQIVKGADMDVSVVWEGASHAYPMDEVIAHPDQGSLDYRFGGNPQTAQNAKTGCLMCFQSCPVGILSNVVYPQGSFYTRDLEFRGRSDVLPPDGTPVTVIVQLPAS